MKTVQATGPYNLIGYSNGGVVAFEMARILLEQGEKVASLMFLDSIPPEQQISDEIDEIVYVCSHLMSVYGLDFRLDVEEFRRVPESGRREYLYSLVAGSGLQITQRQFENNYEVINASERNCRNYRTSKLSKDTNVCLYRATQGSRLLSQDYGWNEFLLSPIRIVDIEADHFGIVKEDASRAVAKDIVLSARKRKRKMETV
jgi:thioesterase domain-containing protein